MTCLPPWWEVRTKVSCDALTSVVSTSKPTLEESFQSRADIWINRNMRTRPFCTLVTSQEVSYHTETLLR